MHDLDHHDVVANGAGAHDFGRIASLLLLIGGPFLFFVLLLGDALGWVHERLAPLAVFIQAHPIPIIGATLVLLGYASMWMIRRIRENNAATRAYFGGREKDRTAEDR